MKNFGEIRKIIIDLFVSKINNLMSVSIEKMFCLWGKTYPLPKQNKKIIRFLHCEKIYCLREKYRRHPPPSPPQKKKNEKKKKK